MEKNLDRKTQEKIVGNCGIACFNRYQFKKDIAINGSGDLDKLIESYKKNFEIWKDGNTVHIRYGEVSKAAIVLLQITEFRNLTIFIMNAPVTLIGLFSKQLWENHSGLILPKV